MPFWNRKKKEKPTVSKFHKKSFFNAWMGAVANSLTENWSRTSAPINEQIKRDLQALRARSRDLAKNDPHAKKFIRLIKSNVVGRKGVVLQSKVPNPDGTLDELAIKAIESEWKEFCKYGVPTTSGNLSFVGVQNLFFDHLLRDGEVIIQKVYSNKVNKYGFGLSFIDPELLSVDNNQDLRNGNKVRMGIELDDNNVVVAYHFISTSTTHKSFYEHHGKGYIRIPADRIIHRFFIEYADQVRGVPEIACVMNRLKNLDGYEEAEIVGKRVAASKMGFFSQNDEGQGYEGEDYNDGVVMDASPGSIEELPNNVSFFDFNPQHNSDYSAFVKTALKSISTGLGISYHSFSNDLEGVNYSTGRLGALEDRDFFMALQDWFIECFYEPIFMEWVDYAIMRGVRLENGGTLRFTEQDLVRYKKAHFQARRWLWVDPQKDMNANKEAINLGLKSRSEIIREQGRDPDDVFNEIAKERERLRELGIPTEPANAGFFMPENEAQEDE